MLFSFAALFARHRNEGPCGFSVARGNQTWSTHSAFLFGLLGSFGNSWHWSGTAVLVPWIVPSDTIFKFRFSKNYKLLSLTPKSILATERDLKVKIVSWPWVQSKLIKVKWLKQSYQLISRDSIIGPLVQWLTLGNSLYYKDIKKQTNNEIHLLIFVWKCSYSEQKKKSLQRKLRLDSLTKFGLICF